MVIRSPLINSCSPSRAGLTGLRRCGILFSLREGEVRGCVGLLLVRPFVRGLEKDDQVLGKELALFTDALLASPKRTRRNFVSCDGHRK